MQRDSRRAARRAPGGQRGDWLQGRAVAQAPVMVVRGAVGHRRGSDVASVQSHPAGWPQASMTRPRCSQLRNEVARAVGRASGGQAGGEEGDGRGPRPEAWPSRELGGKIWKCSCCARLRHPIEIGWLRKTGDVAQSAA
jgi:hypothetical protein